MKKTAKIFLIIFLVGTFASTFASQKVFSKVLSYENIKKLDGWSNYTFMVLLPKTKERFVIKIPKKSTLKLKQVLNVDAYNEWINTNKVYASLNIGPKIAYYDSINNIFVLKYIKNNKTLTNKDLTDPKILKDVILTLKKLHTSKITFNNNVDVFSFIENFAAFFNSRFRNLDCAGAALQKRVSCRHCEAEKPTQSILNPNCKYKDKIKMPKQFNEVMLIFAKIKKIFKSLDYPLAPCHNDTNPGNFLQTANGIKLVDWEYSGNNDPVWGLALLSSTAKFTKKQDIHMLKIYNCKQDNTGLERFRVYKILAELWGFCWTRFQYENITDIKEKQKFLAISNAYFENLKLLIQSEEFINSLNKLERHVFQSTKH